MAKTSAIERNRKRQALAKRYAAKRAELQARGVNIGRPPHEEHGFLLSLFTGPGRNSEMSMMRST